MNPRLLAVLIGLMPGAALADVRSCDIPASLPRPHAELPTADQPTRILPIRGYTLSMIWLPEECRRRSGGQSLRCGGPARFVLHGLWPDGEGKEWPQYCAPAAILPARTIRAHYCVTPSPQLIQHEWAKHGTCMAGYSPDRYLALSSRLFAAVRFPGMTRLSRRPMTAAGFTRAFAAANSGMEPGMIRLNLDRQGWLREVWLCLGSDFRRRTCPAGAGGPDAATPVLIRRGRR